MFYNGAMSTARTTLTDPAGPVVCSEKTWRALTAIRRETLLSVLYDRPIMMAQSNYNAVSQTSAGPITATPDWLGVLADAPDVELPERCRSAAKSEAATLRAALAHRASLVLLEGPIKERAKLSFIKTEGVLAVLVGAYRIGRLSAVKPMVNALRSLGHEEVLPEKAMLDALWRALDQLQDVNP